MHSSPQLTRGAWSCCSSCVSFLCEIGVDYRKLRAYNQINFRCIRFDFKWLTTQITPRSSLNTAHCKIQKSKQTSLHGITLKGPYSSQEKRPPAARCATLKAGCGCALPLVPRGKSHPPLKWNSFNGTFLRPVYSTFQKFSSRQGRQRHKLNSYLQSFLKNENTHGFKGDVLRWPNEGGGNGSYKKGRARPLLSPCPQRQGF